MLALSLYENCTVRRKEYYMKFSEIKNCKDCIYTKCIYRVDYDFSVCPVEEKKQEILNDVK